MDRVLTHLTADDVIRAGACAKGVLDWMRDNAPDATAVPVNVALLSSANRDQRKWILRAAFADGDGDGHGYGQGDDYGNGYGEGDGDGDGYGDGYGYGDGQGHGDGDGYGYGYGYGDV